MAELRFTRDANADLRAILTYSVLEWGQATASDYVRRLNHSCRRLADRPESGRPRPDLREGLRSLTVARHVIFYRIDPAAVIILRVLHSRQDPGPALESGA
jgi:toxin ParE1/3/4